MQYTSYRLSDAGARNVERRNESSVWLMVAGHLPVPMTPEQMQAWTLQRELDERNRPMTDDEIETLLPSGYKVSRQSMTLQCRESGDIHVLYGNDCELLHEIV